MENCPKCGSPIKVVPAGVSKKTGKPYQSFSVCSNRECSFKPQKKEATFIKADVSNGNELKEILAIVKEIRSYVKSDSQKQHLTGEVNEVNF